MCIFTCIYIMCCFIPSTHELNRKLVYMFVLNAYIRTTHMLVTGGFPVQASSCFMLYAPTSVSWCMPLFYVGF